MNLVKPLLWFNLTASIGALIFYFFTHHTIEYRSDFFLLAGLSAQ